MGGRARSQFHRYHTIAWLLQEQPGSVGIQTPYIISAAFTTQTPYHILYSIETTWYEINWELQMDPSLRKVVGLSSMASLKLLSPESLPSGTYLEDSSTKLQNWFI